jgi:hypothetical protein
LGEAIERTVRFDIATIVRDELEELDINERPAAPSDHFTEVALDELHQVPVGRTVGEISQKSVKYSILNAPHLIACSILNSIRKMTLRNEHKQRAFTNTGRCTGLRRL